MTVWSKLVGGVAVFALSGVASAASYTLNLDSFTNAVPPADTRSSGTAVFVPNGTFASPDGDGSVKLETVNEIDGNEKAGPFFYTGTLGTPLGTLGDLGRGALSADWNFISRGANTAPYVDNIGHFRLLVGAPTVSGFAELIWERVYQTTPPTIPTATWIDDLDLGAGKFFSRWNGGAGGDNTPESTGLTLSQWATGVPQITYTAGKNYVVSFSDSTPIYGMQIAIGSAAGDYVAYTDDVNMTFTAIPEPASLSLLGLGGLLMARRRRP